MWILLLIAFGYLFWDRYRPSLKINMDGDVILSYWAYMECNGLSNIYRERKETTLFNIVS